MATSEPTSRHVCKYVCVVCGATRTYNLETHDDVTDLTASHVVGCTHQWVREGRWHGYDAYCACNVCVEYFDQAAEYADEEKPDA